MTKKMNREAYLKRFSRLARWRLPAGEAEEVIADYRELVTAQPEGGEALLKNLGSPFSAAMQIKPAKEYWRWMAVFALLGLCSVYFFCGLFCRWREYEIFNYVLFYFSVGLATFWKGILPKREKRQNCRNLVPAVIGTAALSIASSFFMWSTMWSQKLSGEQAALILRSCAYITSIIALIVSLTGLIRCRMYHRRWLALAIMGFTVLFICLLWMDLLTRLDNADTILPWIQRKMIPPFVIGTAGVIWSLC